MKGNLTFYWKHGGSEVARDKKIYILTCFMRCCQRTAHYNSWHYCPAAFKRWVLSVFDLCFPIYGLVEVEECIRDREQRLSIEAAVICLDPGVLGVRFMFPNILFISIKKLLQMVSHCESSVKFG